MLFNKIYNVIAMSAICVLVTHDQANANCAPTIPFNETKVFLNQATQEVCTTTGLRFDLTSAAKLIYTQKLQLGQNMVASLTKQEILANGKYKCYYQMPLNPLLFEASFDPHVPIPTPPVPAVTGAPTAPVMPITVPPVAAPHNPQHLLPYEQPPAQVQ